MRRVKDERTLEQCAYPLDAALGFFDTYSGHRMLDEIRFTRVPTHSLLLRCMHWRVLRYCSIRASRSEEGQRHDDDQRSNQQQNRICSLTEDHMYLHEKTGKPSSACS